MSEPRTLEERNLYIGGELPAVGDVVQSDGTSLLVLAVEGPMEYSAGGDVLRGVPRDLPPPWGKGSSGWMPDTNADTRNTWLPWRCSLIRRDALAELTAHSSKLIADEGKRP